MKELELRKPYRLQEIIEIVSKNIANNGFTDSIIFTFPPPSCFLLRVSHAEEKTIKYYLPKGYPLYFLSSMVIPEQRPESS